MISRAAKFRIYPTKEQEEYFDKCFYVSNFIFNYFLSEQKEIDDILIMYGLTNKAERNQYKTDNALWFNDYDASKHLTLISKLPKYSFIAEVDSTLRTKILKFLKESFANIRKTGAGFPKFKNRKSKKSFTGRILYAKDSISPTNFSIYQKSKKWCLISLPKIGKIKSVIHREEFILNFKDRSKFKFNSYTISKTPNGHYYISLQLDDNTVDKKPKKPILESTSKGIDRGVVRPITTSDKNDFNNRILSDRFDLLKKQKEKMDQLNRIISNKILKNPNWKESKKYHRLRKKLNSNHNDITNKRNNIQHNITRELVNQPNTDTFIVEDLSIKNMTKRSEKGKSKNKRHLSKAMLDVGMYSIYEMLIYKSDWEGKNVEKVPSQYTSQKCIHCGHINKKNRVSQSIFICKMCGKEENADYVGAVNTKNKFFNK